MRLGDDIADTVVGKYRKQCEETSCSHNNLLLVQVPQINSLYIEIENIYVFHFHHLYN